MRFSPFPILTTERLRLRQLDCKDDNEIFVLRSDINVNKYLDRKPATSLDDAKAFITSISENVKNGNSMYWAITLYPTDQLIGTICLFELSQNNLQAEIGFELLPEHQGKGIMNEAMSVVIDFAARQIGIREITAHTHGKNQSSIKVLEKSQFKLDGTDDYFLIYNLTIFNTDIAKKKIHS